MVNNLDLESIEFPVSKTIIERLKKTLIFALMQFVVK